MFEIVELVFLILNHRFCRMSDFLELLEFASKARSVFSNFSIIIWSGFMLD